MTTISLNLTPLVWRGCNNGNATSYDIASIMYSIYSDFHVCVSIKDWTWYYYNKKLNKWEIDSEGIILKRKISTDLYKQFNRIKIKTSQMMDSEDEPQNSQHDKIAQNIAKVMLKLRDIGFKKKIMIECAELFYDCEKKFINGLDKVNEMLA